MSGYRVMRNAVVKLALVQDCKTIARNEVFLVFLNDFY